jgi:hypothetical protein
VRSGSGEGDRPGTVVELKVPLDQGGVR